MLQKNHRYLIKQKSDSSCIKYSLEEWLCLEVSNTSYKYKGPKSPYTFIKHIKL